MEIIEIGIIALQIETSFQSKAIHYCSHLEGAKMIQFVLTLL